MLASELQIHNFRTYGDATIFLHPYGLLVGKNNCGKSNLIDAVRVFYEDLKYEPGRDSPKFETQDQESWIEIEYCPSEEEFKRLKDEYKQGDGRFRVRKYLRSDETDAEGKKKSGIYAYAGGKLSQGRFYGAKNVQQGKLGRIIHIPPVSTLNDSTKLTGPSPLRGLLNLVLESIIEKSKAYHDLEVAFRGFENNIKLEETDQGVSLALIEKEITDGIKDWNMEFNLAINTLDLSTMVKYLVGHTVTDSVLDEAMPPEQYGQGFQRHLIYTLIRLAANHASAAEPKSSSDFSPSLVWLLYEEPEAFLHPAHIDVLNGSLRDLSATDGTQVLITTHNPQFVSRNVDDLPALVKLAKERATTSVGQMSVDDVGDLFHENKSEIEQWIQHGLSVDPDDLSEDMEAAKHSLWLDPLRCSAFFADFVLLVEGPTERALIPRMFADGSIPLARSGVFVMDCLGKYNIHRFMNLFSKLRISHSVLFDLDNGKQPYIESTIESSRTDKTYAIRTFPVDIETFLGIPRAGSPHRKPQHVMFCYRNGKIEDKKLRELASIIQSLVP